MNRVVVTGLGALTPIGNSVAEFWDGLVAGKCGIDFITRFDTADFRCKLAAEVKNFDPLLRIDKPTVRKTDLYTQYALYAAAEAMEDSALEGKVAPEDFGVYFGSGVGGINTLCAEQDLIREAGPKKVSPQFIPKMIINIAAGQIAIRYGAHGNAMCSAPALRAPIPSVRRTAPSGTGTQKRFFAVARKRRSIRSPLLVLSIVWR